MDPVINSTSDTAPLPDLEQSWVEEQADDDHQRDIERCFQETPRAGHAAIDLTLDEEDKAEAQEKEFEKLVDSDLPPGVIDLTADKQPKKLPRGANIQERNPSVSPDGCEDNYIHNGMVLRSGVTVEIAPSKINYFNASFLYIQLIISTESGVVLRGLPLTRTKNLRGQLLRLRNEVAFVLYVDRDDSRPHEVQAAIEVSVDKVQKIRVCHITNRNFPEHRHLGRADCSVNEIEDDGILICRWKYHRIWETAVDRINSETPLEYVLARISSDEVPKDRFRASDSCLMNAWRGGKVRGGASIQRQLTVNVDAPETPDAQDGLSQDTWISKEPGQQYTLGDMFCGAGGASYGARSAGFRITLSCDIAEGACNTYAVNFPESELHHKDMYKFIDEMLDSRTHVDVLHLSPPCQYWSPAHTTPGINDEANIAILSSCYHLIAILRPRIFTLEQTYGILHKDFEYHFNALVCGFTRFNYSLRYKVVNLLSWGSPARRLRLVIIGACPGEELPPFPADTHSARPKPGDGTRPFRTVKQVLRRIPRNLRGDDIHRPGELKRVKKPRWDANLPLSRTITCNGGVGNYHYNGRRDFTLREYAVLQGFPVDYRFVAPDKKRQIGNAFPPLTVGTLFKHLRKWLEHKDRVYPNQDEDSESSDGEYDGFDDNDDDDDDEYYGSDVEYLGERKIRRASSEVEYLGEWNRRRLTSVVTIKDSDESDYEMDVDAMSQDIGSPGFCIDGSQ
ncbi:hypothetical protein AAE478_008127 [Parahypoxylon ruwenzoriense]